MASPLLQPAFSGGELSPALYGRVDIARYGISLRECKNFVVLPYGGVENRAGFRYVAGGEQDRKAIRIIPFQFSTELSYVIELGVLALLGGEKSSYMRFYSNGAPITAYIDVYPTWVNNVEYPAGQIVRSSGSQYRALSASFGMQPNLHPDLWMPLPDEEFPMELVIPYTEDEIRDVNFTQSADVLYLTHANHHPRELRRVTPVQFELVKYDNKNGPFLTVNADEDVLVWVDDPPSTLPLTGTVTSQGPSTQIWTGSGTQFLSELAAGDVVMFDHIATLFWFVREVISDTEFTAVGPVITSPGSGSMTRHRPSENLVGREIRSELPLFSPDNVGQLFRVEQRDYRDIPPWEPSKRLAGEYENPYGLLRRSEGRVYRCVTSEYIPGNTDEIRTGTVRPTHTRGIEADGDGQPQEDVASRVGVDWEYMHDGYGILLITGYINPTRVIAEAVTTIPEGVVGGLDLADVGPWYGSGDGTETYFLTPGATSFNAYDYEVKVNDEHWPSTRYRISVTATTVSGIVFNEPPPSGTDNITITQIARDHRTDLWAFGAWGEANGYPAEVEFYANRLVFAGSLANPQTVWFTRIDEYDNFGSSTPVVDDDAITATLNARQVNAIRELVPLNNMVLMTSGSEWKTTAGSDEVLAPTTVGFKPQSFNGSRNLPAVIVDNSAIYVSRGSKVRDLGYQFDVDGYAGNDLTIFSSHLIKGHEITSWAYQQVPNSVVWAVRDDGKMLSMTYHRDQQIFAWATHDTQGEFKWVAAVNEGVDDALYAVVDRGGVTTIERMDARHDESIQDAFFLDSGLTYDGRGLPGAVELVSSPGDEWTFEAGVNVQISGTMPFTFESPGLVGSEFIIETGGEPLRVEIVEAQSQTMAFARPLRTVPESLRGQPLEGVWSLARRTLAGLGHLDGQEVSVLADGMLHDPVTVNNGVIELNFAAAVVHAGLPYTSRMTTLDINVPGQETVKLRKKLVKRVGVQVMKTRNILVGRHDGPLQEYEPRQFEDLQDPPELISGTVEVYVASSWEDHGAVTVEQNEPLPLTVLSITPVVEMGE